MPFSARLSARPLWPLRTALVCFLTSVPHLFLDRAGFVYNQLLGTGLLFAAIFAAFVSQATLGGTLRNGFLACRGTVLAALAVTAVVAVAGTSPTAVYVGLMLGSLVIVTPVLQPVSTRMAWAIYTAGLALALEQRGEYQLTLALRLGFVSVVGIFVAVLCSLPPWPRSRASDACSQSLAAAGRDCGAAVDTLTYVLHPTGKACHSAVRAHASRLLAASVSHTDAGAGLLLEVAWECGPASGLGRHVGLLRQCLVFAHGMSMAVDAQRKEDAHQAELLTHVHRAKSSVLDGGAPASSGAADGDVGSRVRSLTDEQVAVLQSYNEQAETMDTMLAGVCASLARCLGAVLDDLLEAKGRDSAWLRWRPWAAQTQGDDCAADGREQRREALRQALVAFDQAVTDVRKALFYAPVEGAQRAEAQARIEVSLAVLGPRTGRYLLLFCLRAMATHVLTAASPPGVPPASPAPVAETRSPRRWGRALKRVLASYGLPPDVPRIIYVLKLTGAVTAALAAGTAIDGSGVWSALSVAFIAPRDHADKHAGGSFRTAALRLSGTIVGSIWGFMAYSVAASAHNVSPLQRQLVALVLLAVGVFVFGLARFSPRHAYGAIVAQFTPYVMGDIPPGVALQQWAIKRIQLNIVGVLIFVFIELFIFPRRAPVALRGELSASLVAARSAVATVWEVQLGAGGVAACPTCCLASAADVAAQVAVLTAGVQRMRALLTEIGDETDWAPLSVSPVPVPPLRPCMALVDDFSTLAVLLGLMHGVLANAGGDAAGGGGGDTTHGAALGRLVTPCAPALRALLSRVWEHYSALEEDLAVAASPKQHLGVGMAPHSPRSGGAQGAQHARAVALARMETALAGFEARTSTVFVSMLRSHRAEAAPVLPSTVMVPFLALCLCTRFLVHNAQHMARHASEMLDMPYSLPPRLDVNGSGGEGRGENGGDHQRVLLIDPSDEDDIHIPAAGPVGVVEDGDSSTCPVCHRARVRPSQRLDRKTVGLDEDTDNAAFVADDDPEARPPRGWDALTPT
jgi:hypothetical protein